jgi:hypothetical protein
MFAQGRDPPSVALHTNSGSGTVSALKPYLLTLNFKHLSGAQPNSCNLPYKAQSVPFEQTPSATAHSKTALLFAARLAILDHERTP